MQNQGVQYYLGMFATEEEAARAYDRKAREEKGSKSQTNFNDDVVCSFSSDELCNEKGHISKRTRITEMPPEMSHVR